MNKQRFSQLVRHYGEIQDEDRIKLHDLVKSYPYSQIIHTLIAKANADASTDVANQTLNYAALYTTDRGVLRNIIKHQGTQVSDDKVVETTNTTQTDATQSTEETSVLTTPPVEESEKQNKVTVDTAVFDKKEVEGLREEIWEDLKRLEINKSNYLSTLEKETAKKSKTTRKASTSAKAKTAVKAKAASKTTKSTSKTSKSSATAKAPATKTTTSKRSATTTKATKTSTAKKTSTKPKKAATKKTTASIVKKKPIIEEQKKLIDNFIDKNPSITAAREVKGVINEQKDLSESSTSFGEDLVSENLAQILSNQGKKNKAIDIYKKLIWKFPQKKSYFAGLIEDLKNK